MKHLQRRAQFLDAGRKRLRDHAPRFHAKHRPQSLATGKHAVAHRFVNGNGMLGFERNQPVESGVGQPLSLFQSFLEHEQEV